MKNKPVKHVLMLLGWYNGIIHRAIARYANKNNWHLEISYTYHRMLSPEGWQGDGIICSGIEVVKQITNTTDVPVVALTKGYDTNREYTIVREDDALISQIAAHYFIEHGFTNFARYPFLNNTCVRQESLVTELQQHGYELMPITIQNDKNTTIRSRFHDLCQQLKKLTPPCAVICENDVHAYELINAAAHYGIRIPEELCVLGANNDTLICESCNVPISSIDTNYDKIGYAAALELDKIMKGQKTAGERIFIKPRKNVITRKSTDFHAVENEILCKAITYISTNYKKKIVIKELAANNNMSMSAFYKLFTNTIGVPPKKVLTKIRIENACRILRTTGADIQSVAYDCGFVDACAMYNAFKKLLNTTPGEYRNSYRFSQYGRS